MKKKEVLRRPAWPCAWLIAIAVACGGKTVTTPPAPPWTAVALKGTTVDRVDLLFAIDNSASMGDKQALLAQAVPDLVNRLLAPRCVPVNAISCTTAADCSALGSGAQCDTTIGSCYVPSGGAACPAGTKLEFQAVHDMHIGIVSSSLGGGGSPDVCVAVQNDPTHQNDNGHLLDRTKGPPEGFVNNAKPLDGSGGNFLAWLPASNPLNAGKLGPNVTKYNDGQQPQLLTEFQSLVTGVQEHGCGLEAQLESWYHFLIQPDPYNTIAIDASQPPRASLQDVDATLLKMRHDFLRPDSLVAIIQLTDEEDSWSDPLWLGGYGWTVRTSNTNLIGGPGSGVGPRGTSECDAPVDVNNVANTGPNNPDCTSCMFPGSTKPVSGTSIGADPNCTSCAPPATTCQKGWYTTTQDGVNVRYSNDMKRRYGVDPQWNVQRYIDGLTLPTAPDRDNEVHDSSQYAATARNCTNPLFAQNLPDGSDTAHDTLCKLPLGSRPPDLVFYAIIGGVPNSLLYNTNGNFKLNLGPDDWTKILGKDPATFQLDGIDPHMIESISPRAGLQTPGAGYTLGSDPDNGREWNTLTSGAGIDLQYACTFQLPAKDCALFPGVCDCTGPATSTADGPPLCDPQNRTMQIRGKAYPTIRELRVAKGLGARSLVASICARDTATADVALPGYGYRPAMNAIASRLSSGLGEPCLPKPLPLAADGTVSCQILIVYPSQTNQAAGCTDPGVSQPSLDLLQQYDAQWGTSQGGPPPVVCALPQLVAGKDYPGPSCEGIASPGWCYVSNAAGCAQAIRFSQGQPIPGTILVLECPPAQ